MCVVLSVLISVLRSELSTQTLTGRVTFDTKKLLKAGKLLCAFQIAFLLLSVTHQNPFLDRHPPAGKHAESIYSLLLLINIRPINKSIMDS